MPTVEAILDSYASQHFRIKHQTFAPSEANQKDTNLKGFIISAWSPKGEELTLEENEQLGRQLLLELSRSKEEYKFERVTVFEKTKAWVEDAYLIENITKTKAKALARKLKQKALIQIAGSTATVHLTRSSETRTFNIHEIKSFFGCPAQENGVENNRHCKQYGYWSTSNAISALIEWKRNLTVVTSRLGCTTCANVTAHPNVLVQTTLRKERDNIIVHNRFSENPWIRVPAN